MEEIFVKQKIQGTYVPFRPPETPPFHGRNLCEKQKIQKIQYIHIFVFSVLKFFQLREGFQGNRRFPDPRFIGPPYHILLLPTS